MKYILDNALLPDELGTALVGVAIEFSTLEQYDAMTFRLERLPSGVGLGVLVSTCDD